MLRVEILDKPRISCCCKHHQGKELLKMKGCNKQKKPQREGHNRKSRRNQHKADVKQAENDKKEGTMAIPNINGHISNLSHRMREANIMY